MAVEGSGGIYALPEDCIATVLSLTSPKDACRLSVVSSSFLSASQSDAVWTRFLPSDYRDIISRAVGDDDLLSKFRSKKDLYIYLSDHPILIDEGRKSFSLDKSTGKKCYMLAAKDLRIAWIDTPQYWQWIKLPESRFPEVAELLGVCWFDVPGKINMHMLSSGTNYAAYLVYTCTSIFFYNAFTYRDTEGSFGISGHECERRVVCLDPDRLKTVPRRIRLVNRRFLHAQVQQENIPMDQKEYPKQRMDGWMEVELGECFVNGDEDGELEVGLSEVKSGDWKSGVVIQGIEIRPKE